MINSSVLPCRTLTLLAVFVLALGGAWLSGCGAVKDQPGDNKAGPAPEELYPERAAYFDSFYRAVTEKGEEAREAAPQVSVETLPKAQDGTVDWTRAVMEGYIDPAGTLEPDGQEKPPLNQNVVIKTFDPKVTDVFFPHTVHTYWLDCTSCHPAIFIPRAGANPIKMKEILDGKWCGRCHGRVSFNFWPESNCTRCHVTRG